MNNIQFNNEKEQYIFITLLLNSDIKTYNKRLYSKLLKKCNSIIINNVYNYSDYDKIFHKYLYVKINTSTYINLDNFIIKIQKELNKKKYKILL